MSIDELAYIAKAMEMYPSCPDKELVQLIIKYKKEHHNEIITPDIVAHITECVCTRL